MTGALTVAIVTPLPPPAGGIASWASDLLSGPIAARVRLIAVPRNPGELDRGALRDGLARVGASVTGAARAVRTILRERPDVLHVCATGTAAGVLRDAPILALARRRGVATVVHVHGSAALLGTGGPLLPLALRTLRHVDAILALNEPSRAFLEGIGLDRVHLVPNAVAERPAAPRRARAPGDPLHVVYVGWIKPAKGVLDLLDAVARVPAVRLTVVGRHVAEGGRTCEPELAARLADPALAGRVVLAGEVPRAEVGRFLDGADVFCLPSHGEGLPVALLEAMMAGLPCVVTDVGGMPEAVVHGATGAVVPARDPAALADALSAYVADPERVVRHGGAARERALDAYGAVTVHGRLEAIWTEIAAPRRAA
jgi:glycosyltransferase involved in cell wall biosynthesis